jgi:hypothetical protein
VFTLELPLGDDDDPDFILLIARLISGAVITHRPAELIIVKIDHWFDHKWLGFSGKFLGAVGAWRPQVTIPPFVANRIVGQMHFFRDEEHGTYVYDGPGPRIHHSGSSGSNLYRRVSKVVPATALFWCSGDTRLTRRGSLMGYNPVEKEYWTWFLDFNRGADWQITKRKGIHEYEVRAFQEASAANWIA